MTRAKICAQSQNPEIFDILNSKNLPEPDLTIKVVSATSSYTTVRLAVSISHNDSAARLIFSGCVGCRVARAVFVSVAQRVLCVRMSVKCVPSVFARE